MQEQLFPITGMKQGFQAARHQAGNRCTTNGIVISGDDLACNDGNLSRNFREFPTASSHYRVGSREEVVYQLPCLCI